MVLDPVTGKPVPVDQVQEAISGPFKSLLYGLELTVPKSDAVDDEHDWPLILGLSIVGALTITFLVVTVIYV